MQNTIIPFSPRTAVNPDIRMEQMIRLAEAMRAVAVQASLLSRKAEAVVAANEAARTAMRALLLSDGG